MIDKKVDILLMFITFLNVLYILGVCKIPDILEDAKVDHGDLTEKGKLTGCS